MPAQLPTFRTIGVDVRRIREALLCWLAGAMATDKPSGAFIDTVAQRGCRRWCPFRKFPKFIDLTEAASPILRPGRVECRFKSDMCLARRTHLEIRI